MSRARRDDFYIGWQQRAPASLARRIRLTAAILLALLAAAAAALSAAQHAYGPGIFEFGHERSFEGVVSLSSPPVLAVARPGEVAASERTSRYLLVGPGKHGAGDLVAPVRGRLVRLRGTLAYREGTTVIELVPGSIEPRDVSPGVDATATPLGPVRLRGEIVDSKCYLGVMNPGSAKPHRACAVRCISGGIPPLFVARDAEGRSVQFLLVGADGRSIHREVLDFVAEPVEIEGEAERLGDLLVLRAKRIAR